MPPAKTGNDKRSKNEVTRTDHINKGILNKVKPSGRIFKIVTIILIAPNIEDAPARCILKIAKSTEGPECPFNELNGG
jgi:hypothetical protein